MDFWVTTVIPGFQLWYRAGSVSLVPARVCLQDPVDSNSMQCSRKTCFKTKCDLFAKRYTAIREMDLKLEPCSHTVLPRFGFLLHPLDRPDLSLVPLFSWGPSYRISSVDPDSLSVCCSWQLNPSLSMGQIFWMINSFDFQIFSLGKTAMWLGSYVTRVVAEVSLLHSWLLCRGFVGMLLF